MKTTVGFSVCAMHRWLPFSLEQDYGQQGYRSGEHRFDWWYYDRRYWRRYFAELTDDGFNALFLWNIHPFPALIRYGKFREAALFDEPETERNVTAFRAILDEAHAKGIAVHLMQYIIHFSGGFARARGYKKVSGGYGEIDTPEVRAYGRYCTEELFATYPDLDGLMLCGETNPDAFDFIQETVVDVLNGLSRKPSLHLRLWGVHFAEGVLGLKKSYRGSFAVCHKILREHVAAPVCDPRIGLWIRDLKGCPLMALLGPGNASGFNARSLYWGSPEFTHALLRSAAETGVTQLGLTQDMDNQYDENEGPPVWGKRETKHREAGWLARKSVGYYAKNCCGKFDPAVWPRLIGARYGIARKAGTRLVYRAMEEASSVLTRNACAVDQTYGTLRGFDASNMIGRFSMSTFVDNPGDFRLSGPYRYPAKGVSGPDYLPIMEYCENPRRRGISPLQTAKALERSRVNTDRFLRMAEKDIRGKKLFSPVKEYLLFNGMIGGYYSRALRSSTRLYQVLYARTLGEARSRLAEAIAYRRQAWESNEAILRQALAIPILIPGGGAVQRLVNEGRMLRPELVNCRRLSEWLGAVGESDFRVFKHYCESLRIFLMTGQYVRFNTHLSAPTLRTAARLLDQAAQAARRAVRAETGDGRRRKQLSGWLDFLTGERARLEIPSCECSIGSGRPRVLSLRDDLPMLNSLSCVEYLLAFFTGLPGVPAPASHWPTIELSGSRAAMKIAVRNLPPPGGIGDPVAVFLDPGMADHLFYRIMAHTDGYREPVRRVEVVAPHGLRVDRQFSAEYEMEIAGRDMDIRVPWRVLGGAPRPGEEWGLNVWFNAYGPEAAARNWTCMNGRPGAWCPMFSGPAPVGDPARFGLVCFR